MKLRLLILTVVGADELDTKFASARKAGIRALLVRDDPLFDVLGDKLVEAAARYKILTMYYVWDFVAAGGLVMDRASTKWPNRWVSISAEY